MPGPSHPASPVTARPSRNANLTGRARAWLGPLLAMLLCLAAALSSAAPVTVTPISLEDFDGLLARADRCVVVAMAAWCGPCKTELPHLARLYREFRDKGLVLFGLSLDYGGVQAMQPVVNRFGVEFPVYWVGEAGVTRYGLNPIPMLVFLEHGRIVERVSGAHDEEELRMIFERFLERNTP